MAAAQVTAGGAYALSLAIIVAIIYLAMVRFMAPTGRRSLRS